ncbi:UvrD-helicase domain-containing protein [Paenibacillus sp. y28]|uniref:UvrD-helicase domain-containing protein n=1 Tax=Paenibacillus sp. y28 TaxID=3129110 RepID=UPI00301B05DE
MEPRFLYSRPLGTAGSPIPLASIASLQTSAQLVGPGEEDAYFFRALEQQGLYLNQAQIEAVRHGEGPLLTLAGAGSGKTSVLISRAGYLISVRSADPGHMLLLTFSSKAAAEMRERIVQLPVINARSAGRVQARTFHAFFLYLLRSQGYQQAIFSETRRQHILLKQMMRELNIQDSAYQPESLLSLLSSYKMNLQEVSELPDKTDHEQQLKQIFLHYEAWKHTNDKIDFDDVLLQAYRLLQQSPDLLQTLQNRFRYVMVDEFQDTNTLQYELVKMIAAPQNNLMVVGDDDQTIYSFNGAHSEFILHFERTFPAARVVTLDVNYRSFSGIVGLGNQVIRHNQARRHKTLQATQIGEKRPLYMRPRNADDEAAAILQFIEQEIQEGRRDYGDFAILYRSASNNRAFIEQLLLQDIPHIDYGDGQLLYDHWAVKPVIDHLRLSLDRRDFAAMESVLPTLYMNREQGMQHIRRMEQQQPKKGPLVHLLAYPGLKEFQLAKIKARLELIRLLPQLKPLEAIIRMRKEFYDAYIETGDKHPLTRHKEQLKETLDELEASAGRFATVTSFLAYIDELTAKSGASGGQLNQEQGNRIALMTIHRSKGLEFPVVFVIGACEGSLPHSSALEADRMNDLEKKQPRGTRAATAVEEERRLAYVAITRAREELIISSPAQFRGKKAEISRFILSAFPSAAGAGKASGGSGSGSGGNRTGQPNDAAAPGNAGGGKAQQTKTVPAWICTSKPCSAWSRIMTAKEARQALKQCPLCKSPMERGSRQVPV